jgi:GT2 family glycosyltransferase
MGITVVVPVRDGGQDLVRCLEGVRAQTERSFELVVVDDGSRDGSAEAARALGARVIRHAGARGPAQARNAGAAASAGEILVFFDADTVPHQDALARIKARFTADPRLDAVSGRYDDDPADAHFVSRYRNLLHSFTHQQAAGPAGTFWGGCGAIRRAVFAAAGGFDARFGAPSVEDIELGMRLAREGRRLEIDPEVQVKHLKRWTLTSMIRTDIWSRAVPWAHLLLSARQAPPALNLRWSQRASVAAAVFAPASAFLHPMAAAALLALHAALNWKFFVYLARTQGGWFAAGCWPLHLLHHLYSGLALPLALATYPWRKLSRTSPPLREVAP